MQKYFFLALSTPRLGSAGQAAAIPAVEVTLQLLLLLPWAAATEPRAASAAALQKRGKEEEETREQVWEGEWSWWHRYKSVFGMLIFMFIRHCSNRVSISRLYLVPPYLTLLIYWGQGKKPQGC